MKTWISGLMVSILAPSVVLALQCVAPGPVCSVFAETDVIFRGKVIEVTTLPRVPHTVPNPDGTTSLGFGPKEYEVRFQVAEMFRGAPAKELTLYTDDVSGFPFRKGKQYVVFASAGRFTNVGSSEKQLSTSFCTRTHEFDPSHSDADVVWMRGRATAPDGASIFGAIKATPEMDSPPLATVSVRGALDRDLVPDRSGAYRLEGLPKGAYSVSAKLPPGFTTQPARRISLEQKGCAEVDWTVRFDSHVRGRVLDADGAPVANISVTLVQQGTESAAGYLPGIGLVITNEEGRYDFTEAPPGAYFVVANNNGPSPGVPYPSVFYPSAKTIKEASLVQLGPSATLDAVDLTLPKAMHSVTINMTVTMQDGSAPKAADVTAHDLTALNSGNVPTTRTDKNGRASLAVYEGRTYYLTATAYSGTKQSCGGPFKFTAQEGMNLQPIVIAHNWGNCLAQLNPGFNAPE